MLVISRKKNERLMIADGEIVITIVEIRGDKVKLGIEAPPSISVDREEVYKAKLASNSKAAGQAGEPLSHNWEVE